MIRHADFGKFFEQPVEGSPIGVTREKLVAVNKVEKRHRFTPQRVDHMAIIDDMRVLSGRGGASACQSHQRCSTNEQIQPVIIEPDTQPMSDEPLRAADAGRVTGSTFHLQLHQTLGRATDHTEQKVGIGGLLRKGLKVHGLRVIGLGSIVVTKPYRRSVVTTAPIPPNGTAEHLNDTHLRP
jgi:hypothetical protein